MERKLAKPIETPTHLKIIKLNRACLLYAFFHICLTKINIPPAIK